MLVPLETLSGWPAVDDPSALQVLGLLIGLPAVVFVAIVIIAKIGNARHASRGTGVQVIDPVWVGGTPRPDIEGPEHDAAVANAGRVADKPKDDVGGAGASW